MIFRKLIPAILGVSLVWGAAAGAQSKWPLLPHQVAQFKISNKRIYLVMPFAGRFFVTDGGLKLNPTFCLVEKTKKMNCSGKNLITFASNFQFGGRKSRSLNIDKGAYIYHLIGIDIPASGEYAYSGSIEGISEAALSADKTFTFVVKPNTMYLLNTLKKPPAAHLKVLRHSLNEVFGERANGINIEPISARKLSCTKSKDKKIKSPTCYAGAAISARQISF